MAVVATVVVIPREVVVRMAVVDVILVVVTGVEGVVRDGILTATRRIILLTVVRTSIVVLLLISVSWLLNGLPLSPRQVLPLLA